MLFQHFGDLLQIVEIADNLDPKVINWTSYTRLSCNPFCVAEFGESNTGR